PAPGVALPARTTYSRLTRFSLALGAGNDTVNIAGTQAGLTRVDAGGGADEFNVSGSAGPVQLAGGPGGDRFNISGFGAGVQLAGDDGADDLRMTVAGQPSADPSGPGVTATGIETVLLDNTGNTQDTHWRLTGGAVQVTDGVATRTLLATSGAVTTELRLGSGADTVTAVDIGNQTTIDAGGGGDTFRAGTGRL